VGCGERAVKATLLRVVGAPDGLRHDPGRALPGRGAYLHATPSCWDEFARRRGRVRSLGMTPSRAERERLVKGLAAPGGAEIAR
jgi:hypothetical protein